MKPIKLDELKSNYKFENDAMEYLQNIYQRYGGYIINYFLGEYENVHTLNDLIEVEKSIRKLVICISTDEELFDPFEVYPNSDEVMDADQIFDRIERQDFLVFFTFFHEAEQGSKSYYEYLVMEGSKYDKCPYALKNYCEELRKKWLANQ